jgi:hypothetical protein
VQAKVLYDAVRASDGFYNSPVEEKSRSQMNIPFTIPSSEDLEKEFLKESAKAGFVRTSIIYACICAVVHAACCFAQHLAPLASKAVMLQLHPCMRTVCCNACTMLR